MGPAGLEVRVGEGGRPLSAGELQRVALARAVLRRSPMYLLDEPTAHLDRAGEDVVLEGLAGALRGSSALIVSHRPTLARLADRAVALHQGRFVPVAHEDLDVRQAPAGAALA